MTRQEYMEKLANAISHCPKSQQEEILADFNEHFDIGVEKGFSEEEIIESLGDIKDIIKDLKVEENRFIKPIFDMDDEINEVEIVCEDCDVNVVKGEKVEMNLIGWRPTMNNKYNISEKIIDNKYIIKVESIKKHLLFFADLVLEVSINNSIKKIRVDNKNGDVKYDINSLFLEDAELTIGNGDVEVIGEIENLSVNNNMGDVKIDTIAGENVNINTNLGDIDILSSANEVYVKSNNGDIIFDIKAKSLDIHSNKGDIDGTVSSDIFHCSTNLGGIDCTIIEAKEVECTSKMGDITADITPIDDYILKAKATMGDVNTSRIDAIECGDCFIKGDQSTSIYLKTSMGDIEVED